MLHYEVATDESEADWTLFFEHLIARGLCPDEVKLVVSDWHLRIAQSLAEEPTQCTTTTVYYP